MNRKKSKIIIVSNSVFSDPVFKLELGKQFDEYFCLNTNDLQKLIKNIKCDLLLIEINSAGKELQIIKGIHERFPKLPIIAIGLDKPLENLIKAFQYDIIDFFKLPYKRDLLLERIKMITKLKSRTAIKCKLY